MNRRSRRDVSRFQKRSVIHCLLKDECFRVKPEGGEAGGANK